jgi:hypothetical protein
VKGKGKAAEKEPIKVDNEELDDDDDDDEEMDEVEDDEDDVHVPTLSKISSLISGKAEEPEDGKDNMRMRLNCRYG